MDDESAVLLAEHTAELSEHFLFPHVDPDLPRTLASKQKLYDLCRRYDVPAPVTASPATGAELVAFAQQATFPVVVKVAEPWWWRAIMPSISASRTSRTRSGSIPSTTS